jgi:hypothetical protein
LNYAKSIGAADAVKATYDQWGGDMKRDWDLLRKQLTDIEADHNVLEDLPEEPTWGNQPWEEFENQTKEYNAAIARIAGHLEMLIDNGYLDGLTIMRGADGHIAYGVHMPRLTMAGHDLLDTMRSSPVWETIKSTAKSKGIELTFDAIKALGVVALKHAIG